MIENVINIQRKEFPIHNLVANGKSTIFSLKSRQDAFGQITCSLMTQCIKAIEHSDKIELSIDFPDTWWDHFKHCVLNKFKIGQWFVKKFPVRMLTLRKEFRFNLETIALVNYEYVKQLGAHEPFIRINIVGESDKTIFKKGDVV